MALDNTIVWIFSPDLGESHELADYGHTTHDNKITRPSGERFDPNDVTLDELRRAVSQYHKLTGPQVLELGSIERVAIDPAWNDKAVEIIIMIRDDLAGANETRLPARARNRLRSLRAGNPNVGESRP